MFETRIFIASTESLKDGSLFDRFYSSVPKYRRQKIDALSSLDEKCLSLASGLLLSRAILHSGHNEDEMEYAYRESGMPYFKGIDNFYFSIAKSNERVIVAVSSNPIGVDVEFMDGRKDAEVEQWVRTESYAKATDTSIAVLLEGRTALNSEFRFMTPFSEKGYKYAVCSEEFLNPEQVQFVKEF